MKSVLLVYAVICVAMVIGLGTGTAQETLIGIGIIGAVAGLFILEGRVRGD